MTVLVQDTAVGRPPADTTAQTGSTAVGRPVDLLGTGLRVGYHPILDVTRGAATGFLAVTQGDRRPGSPLNSGDHDITVIAVGGRGAAQPELTSIVRLKPAIIRLGRARVRRADHSEAKRAAIEVTGRLAATVAAGDGVLRALLQQVYTTTDPAAAQRVLPETTGFAPLACTDNAGRFLGVLRIETLMAHLTSSRPCRVTASP